jgi:pimeloyl-ACP methyl ester carboxylesterase
VTGTVTARSSEVIGADGVRLVTTDHGGDGPALVLLHGLGDSRRAMAGLAARLTGMRVVTVDLRGHGDSQTGAWGFDAAVADLDAVVACHGLHRPYVGGHSLGGMVALRYALAGRPVAGAVNLDGWGPGVASRFPGADPAKVSAHLVAVAAGVLPSRLASFLAGRSRQSKEGTTGAVLRELHGVDVVAWHRGAPCPTLAIHATAPAGRVVRRVLGADTTELQRAHHDGLCRDLAVAADDTPDLRVVNVAATHALCRTHPDEVAAAVRAFVADVEDAAR